MPVVTLPLELGDSFAQTFSVLSDLLSSTGALWLPSSAESPGVSDGHKLQKNEKQTHCCLSKVQKCTMLCICHARLCAGRRAGEELGECLCALSSGEAVGSAA